MRAGSCHGEGKGDPDEKASEDLMETQLGSEQPLVLTGSCGGRSAWEGNPPGSDGAKRKPEVLPFSSRAPAKGPGKTGKTSSPP